MTTRSGRKLHYRTPPPPPRLATQAEEDTEDNDTSDTPDTADDMADDNQSENGAVEPQDVPANQNTVYVGGIPVVLNAQPTAVTTAGPLYKKEARAALSDDKRNDLFDKATRKAHTKYDVISLTLSDKDTLDDTYNLKILVGKTKAHFVTYNIAHIFTIVQVGQDGQTVTGEKNLLDNFTQVTPAEAAASNKWYNRWASQPYFRENLQLSLRFFQNNVTEKLWEKCYETTKKYTEEEQGGPLFFAVMIGHLLSNTEEAALSLQKKVESLNIATIPGKNVSRAVSLVRGAVARLAQVNSIPTDLPKKLLLVFQTTMVDEFNATFKHLGRTRAIQAMTGDADATPSVDQILDLAEVTSRDLVVDNKWNGTTAKEAAFSANLVCWNCGAPGHSMNDCPKPKNAAKIKQASEKFRKELKKKRKAKKKSTPPADASGNHSPPTEAERGRRVINGVPMFSFPLPSVGSRTATLRPTWRQRPSRRRLPPTSQRHPRLTRPINRWLRQPPSAA